MKYLVSLLCLVFFTSCSIEEKKSNVIIDEFIKEFFLSENYDLNKIKDYMVLDYKNKYNSLTSKNKKIHTEYITSSIKQIRKYLSDNDFIYEIIEKDQIESDDFNKTIVYHGKGNVFALKTGGEILMFFIVEGNKIYSFCTDVYLSSETKLVPYFFFDEQKLIQN